MTIREMHIDFNQQTQQVAANRSRKWELAEIDFILNKQEQRFIQSKLKRKQDGSGGFELDQLDADSVRSLIVPSFDMTPYIDDDTRYKCFLPYNYMYLLSDWSYTTQICTYDDDGNLVVPEVNSRDLYTKAIRQEQSGKDSAPYYETVVVNLGDASVNVPNDLPYMNGYTGFNRLEDISFLVPFIALTGGWYWERFEDRKYPGYYISLSEAPTGDSSIVIDGDTFTQTIENFGAYQYHGGVGKYFDNRLTASNRVSGLNSTEFIKSSYYSPVSELGNNVLYVYRDESFTISKVAISYIRRPIPMSISLNTSSELPPEFHQQIVDLAVEYVLGTIKDIPGLQAKKADMQRVVL